MSKYLWWSYMFYTYFPTEVLLDFEFWTRYGFLQLVISFKESSLLYNLVLRGEVCRSLVSSLER